MPWTGEQIIIRYAWKQILDEQAKQRQALKDVQERAREKFYHENKTAFDTMPLDGGYGK